MVEPGDGTFILSGYSRSSENGDLPEKKLGNSDLWILKVGAEGEMIWDSHLHVQGSNWTPQIAMRKNGSFLIAASSHLANAEGDLTVNSYGESDLIMFELDHNGQKINDWSYGGLKYEYGARIFNGLIMKSSWSEQAPLV